MGLLTYLDSSAQLFVCTVQTGVASGVTYNFCLDTFCVDLSDIEAESLLAFVRPTEAANLLPLPYRRWIS